jgi:hypothetical protein
MFGTSGQLFITASSAIGGAGSGFPFSGSAVITGSLLVSGSGLTVTGSLAISNLTPGSVIFAGANGILSQSNSNFFWDNTNGRLGIGTATPVNPLQVVGTIRAASLLASNGITAGATTTANASAVIDIISTTKGFLPTRTDLTSNIATPAQGLITYLTGSTNEGLYYYSSGSIKAWTKVLNDTGSQSITGSLTATSFTGSLQGTASWAQNAVTASYVLQAVSASFATTASFALNTGGGGGGTSAKAGSGSAASFLGTPRSSSITFASAFSDNSYAVTVTGEDARTFTIQSKSSTGFTINSNSSVALTGPVYWIATAFN